MSIGFISESAVEYHSKANRYLSSHQLIDYMKSPYGYWYKHNVASKQPEPSAFFIGRAVHKYVLEGAEAFGREYIVGGPINPKTGKSYGVGTQKYQEWLDEIGGKGLVGITEEDAELIKTANKSVYSHLEADKLLSEGFAEGVVRSEYCGVGCQIRLDWFNPSRGIIDLKTCRNLDRFAYDFKDYWYANQMSFYREVYKSAFGEDCQTWIVACELSEPYRTGVFLVGDKTLEDARIKNEDGIARFVRSRYCGEYPTEYEDVRIL